MNKLLRQYRSGSLDISIDDSDFAGVDAVPDAVEYLQSGESMGKVVVRFPE
jgi:NADPH-dependent curcumin reductase CurA